MPVNANTLDSALVVTYQTGTTEDGGPVLKQRTFSNIRADVSNQELFEAAEALFSLQKHSVTLVKRYNRFELSED